VFALWFAIPWTFTYLLLGKLIGAGFFTEYVVNFAILVLLAGITSWVCIEASTKLAKNRTRKSFILSLIMCMLIVFLVISLFSLIFISQVVRADDKISTFVAENRNFSFQDYVTNLTVFLDSNVRAAYGTFNASFQINRLIYGTAFDRYILGIWGLTEADIIVYQGWGSCGEAAILIEELLYRAGYETRLAYFIGIDHEWAEVKYNGTWLIVDPWYIGNFVETENLRNVKPAFQNASGVDVLYMNGTICDASKEDGY
jgi:hypothetical protein